MWQKNRKSERKKRLMSAPFFKLRSAPLHQSKSSSCTLRWTPRCMALEGWSERQWGEHKKLQWRIVKYWAS